MNRSKELLEEFDAATQRVSWMPGWITNALTKTELGLGRDTGAGYTTEKTETLLDVAIPSIYGPTAGEKWF